MKVAYLNVFSRKSQSTVSDAFFKINEKEKTGMLQFLYVINDIKNKSDILPDEFTLDKTCLIFTN